MCGSVRWRTAIGRAQRRDPVALRVAVVDQRTEDEQARSLRQREDLVDDLLDGLALDGMAVWAVRDADPCEEEPEVVVDLGDSPDRRARVARGALLVDQDGRRQAVDLVDVRRSRRWSRSDPSRTRPAADPCRSSTTR